MAGRDGREIRCGGLERWTCQRKAMEVHMSIDRHMRPRPACGTKLVQLSASMA
jgi:hypothetical protein